MVLAETVHHSYSQNPDRMLYIKNGHYIAPHPLNADQDPFILHDPVDGKFRAEEPAYEGIPPGILRRMGKAVRMGVGAAIPLLREYNPSGIIIGTANGGMEDCIKFLNQIIEYEEGMLTPGNFVQSTTNAIAAQIGLMQGNKGYNITHVHRGLAFENALTDAWIQLNEHNGNSYLLGAVDEISSYHYNIEWLDGSYKMEAITQKNFYTGNTPGSIAGEGAVMFMVSKQQEDALLKVDDIHTWHQTDSTVPVSALHTFLGKNGLSVSDIDVLVSGENGDNRLTAYYLSVENIFPEETVVLRFKHICGEYATAASIALYFCCSINKHQVLPSGLVKKRGTGNTFRKMLIYNNYKGYQHSFMLVSDPRIS